MMGTDPLLLKDENNPIYNTYITLLSCFRSCKKGIGEENARTFLSQNARKLFAPAALDVLLHLETYQGYTLPGLVGTLKTTWSTAYRIHKNLLDMGLVREVVKVDRRFLSGNHRPVPVFLLLYAPPEAAHDAMRRYAEIPRKGHRRPTQATVDEAIAAIKCIMGPTREATLRALIPQLKVKRITYEAAAEAAKQLTKKEGLKIWT